MNPHELWISPVYVVQRSLVGSSKLHFLESLASCKSLGSHISGTLQKEEPKPFSPECTGVYIHVSLSLDL